MDYIGVDLAARFSAAVVLNEGGEVIHQFDSWGREPWDFCSEVAGEMLERGALLAVEDLPYGLSRQAQIKPPIRVQGMLIAYLARWRLLPDTFFIAPATWQRSYEGVWKGGPKGATAAAEARGYFAPDLLAQYSDDVPPLGKEHAKQRSKIRGQLKKASTDYNDSYLIAEFARTTFQAGDWFTTQGVQQVTRD